MNDKIKLHGHRLLQAGIILFLIGLLSGFFINSCPLKILGIAAHLVAFICGIFLLALGCIWNRLNISTRLSIFGMFLAIYGTYCTWFIYFIAGAWGAGGMFPIASKGVTGTVLQENIILFLTPTAALSLIVLCIIVLLSLCKNKTLCINDIFTEEG
jgi:(hydroxyamino)benzene mutase